MCCSVPAASVHIRCFLSWLAAWGLVCELRFLHCLSVLVGWLSILKCAFWGFLSLFALLRLFPLFRLFVTHNSGNRCNSAKNGRKPQKAHSRTESQPTSADQQHKNGSTRTRSQTAGDDKKHSTRTGLGETKQHVRHQTSLSATK